EIVALAEKSFRRQGLVTDLGSTAAALNAALESAGRCRGFIARSRQHVPLGAVWIVWDDKRAYYLIGGFDDAANSSNSVPLAIGRAIEFTAGDLCLSEFDFEGSMIPAVERFFRKFGGTLLPTYTISYRKPVSLGNWIARKVAKMTGATLSSAPKL